MKVAYFGEHGSFSHLVAMRRFANNAARRQRYGLVSSPTIDGCFAGLEAGDYDQVVVPIENASSGMITHTVDQLILLAHRRHPELAIREALHLRVKLALLTRRLQSSPKVIYSHPAPLVHAKEWLDAHFPLARREALTSTSEAARRVKGERGAAAIAGVHAAELYGLKVMSRDIDSGVPNRTTFFVVGRELKSRKQPTHTTLVFELPHEPGSLVAVLQTLARQKLNLTRIESRPIPGRFSEYRFMVEVEGVPDELGFHRALNRLQYKTTFCSVLGSYPVSRVQS
ncbi:MAG: prephenate dehydratase domain-containing protein [Verrucomicrobiota bacterium]